MRFCMPPPAVPTLQYTGTRCEMKAMPKEPPKTKFDPTGDLPDNIADCHSLIRELFARVAELEKQLSRRNRALFGSKSAKVDATLLTGTGKAIHMQTTNELDA